MVQQVERFLQSRRFDLYKKLGSKLLIEDESAQGIPPLVSRSVQPVVDVSGLLLVEDALLANGDLTGTIGDVVIYHTVPVGQRWHLRWFTREIAAAGTHVVITKSVVPVTFDITVNTAAAQFGTFSGIIIEENDSVNLLATANGADTSIQLAILFGRELLN